MKLETKFPIVNGEKQNQVQDWITEYVEMADRIIGLYMPNFKPAAAKSLAA
jgi:hypothetical protein